MSTTPGKPTTDEILAVARTTLTLLRKRGLDCCLFGGAACSLYGTTRTPNDVDVVVFTADLTPEQLKADLVSMDGSFYLMPARARDATYKVLWYRLPGVYFAHPRTGRLHQKVCKIDVLVPPALHIPPLRPAQLRTLRGLHVMPLVPLLLLKLQGWDDHRNAPEAHHREKQFTDVRDVGEMLTIAVKPRHGASLTGKHVAGLPDEFVEAGRRRLEEFRASAPTASVACINRILWKPLTAATVEKDSSKD